MTSKVAPIRPEFSENDVQTIDNRIPWQGFFHVDEREFRFRKFDGQFSQPISRSTYVTSGAVTVLPFDPVRDRIVLVEQFRIAAHVRGDTRPWVIECPAGRIDADESPENTARRETFEECGLLINSLLPVAGYYPSVGGNTGYFHSYVGLCDIPDDAAGFHGMAAESEDIKTHIVGFHDAMEMLDRGDFNTAPLILSLNWLARHRASFSQTA